MNTISKINMTSRHQEETSDSMPLHKFLVKLLVSSELMHVPITYQIFRWVADYIDSCQCWVGVRRDPLHLPIGHAVVRSRAVHPVIVKAVVSEVSAGKLGRSGNAVCQGLVRFSYNRMGLKPKTGNKWTDPTFGQEACARWRYLQSLVTDHYSICLDATRLGGLDTLFLALHLPQYNLTGWCPQQAPDTVVKHAN